MEQGDFPVRHPPRIGSAVKAGLRHHRQGGHRFAVFYQGEPSLSGFSQKVRRARRVGGPYGRVDRHAVDDKRPALGGPGPAAAAPYGVRHTDAQALDFSDDVLHGGYGLFHMAGECKDAGKQDAEVEKSVKWLMGRMVKWEGCPHMVGPFQSRPIDHSTASPFNRQRGQAPSRKGDRSLSWVVRRGGAAPVRRRSTCRRRAAR